MTSMWCSIQWYLLTPSTTVELIDWLTSRVLHPINAPCSTSYMWHVFLVNEGMMVIIWWWKVSWGTSSMKRWFHWYQTTSQCKNSIQHYFLTFSEMLLLNIEWNDLKSHNSKLAMVYSSACSIHVYMNVACNLWSGKLAQSAAAVMV